MIAGITHITPTCDQISWFCGICNSINLSLQNLDSQRYVNTDNSELI